MRWIETGSEKELLYDVLIIGDFNSINEEQWQTAPYNNELNCIRLFLTGTIGTHTGKFT